MKKKNFNNLNTFPIAAIIDKAFLGITGVLLLCHAPLLSAESTVTRQEKSDKVVSNTIIATDAGSVDNVTDTRVLYAEQWELARSGESILELPVLNQVVNKWLLDKDNKIEIQYPGGEEGELWVQQLTDWLVSLGVPSGDMLVVPGSGTDDTIKFDIIK